jgi:transposase
VQCGECTVAEAAERYAVSTAALERWLRRQRETGQCAAAPHAGGPARKLAGLTEVIRAAIEEMPDITLAELCEQVRQDHGVSSSRSMMCREVARLDLPVKKSRSTPVNGTRPKSSSNARPSGRTSQGGM